MLQILHKANTTGPMSTRPAHRESDKSTTTQKGSVSWIGSRKPFRKKMMSELILLGIVFGSV